jgi:hypothetical protein
MINVQKINAQIINRGIASAVVAAGQRQRGQY